MPALHLAQEHYGWLPPEAFREVADALDLTPAYCQAVASFYDMYHLAPVGEHVIEVCTNVSCALVGAQAGARGLPESSSASRPADTSEDGKWTLRTLECAGGCGWATVVAVDHRYRERVARRRRRRDRGGAPWRVAAARSQRVVLEHADERDLTQALRVRGRRRLRLASSRARARPRTRWSRACSPPACAAAAAPASRRAARRASCRSRATPRTRST